ncbi:MAG: TonB-dependent receptor [Woeseiaceae bacterium]
MLKAVETRSHRGESVVKFQRTIIKLAIGALGLTSLTVANAQSAGADDEAVEEVIVTGIRGSLATAIDQKRNSDQLVEVVIAEDIGKLPDQNLAEVLEGITGVQITRTAGVGTGVQIRGTNANRIEINGVSTVGSGAGRSGIDFEDVNASIISAVEVIKTPDAKTIEGSVGGTINLKTIRPLDLDRTLGTVRVQGEESSLGTEGVLPRLSGAFGKKWDTGAGEMGFVISASYTEQEAVSFRPRTDRDNLATPPGADPAEFLGIQFLVQEQENDLYETTNIATTFEWAPSDSLRLHADVVINEQERAREQYRLQASGVSSLRNISVPTSFTNVNFGVGNDYGMGVGVYPSAFTGFLEPDLANDDDDPNLRFNSETASRVTDSEIIALGADWQGERFSVYAEFATTSSDTTNPTFNTQLNFINPNCPLDGAPIGDPDTSNDNCVPFVYDLSGKSLSWDVNFDSPFAPTTAQMLDPANIVLDQVDISDNSTENSEDAFRVDVSYEFDGFLSSLDAGFRYNESSSEFVAIGDRIGGFSRMEDSPPGTLFEELLVKGPSNFGDADGRALYVSDFLYVDPKRSFNDPAGTLQILEDALAAWRVVNPQADGALTAVFEEDLNQYYNVGEETTAVYLQANFQGGIFRGNLGVRYLETDISSTAYGPAEDGLGNRELQTTKGSYDFVLPRLNVVADLGENWVGRFSYGSDIRRPDFDQLNTGFEFDPSENDVVELGNPGLEPEEVDSLDLSVEWYFAPSAVASVGYFRKERTNIFGNRFEGAVIRTGPTDEGFVTTGGLSRETNPPCTTGIFNPAVVPNQLGDPDRTGMCVDFLIPGNDPETTTVDGIEINFQYDLSVFEDRLGWASGFGILANYTKQDFGGGSDEDCTSGRGLTVLGDVCMKRGLLDFSEDAYNLTLYYEKYGLSARLRYTWRERFYTEDFAGGANTSGSSTFSFPVYTLDRSQLNASIMYYINDNFNVSLEGVNLTEEPIYQHCVAPTGPLCFAGYPDRRLLLGASYRF